MKQRIIVFIIVITLLILLIPIPNYLKDGGTVEYRALIYKISKVHKLNTNSNSGYDDGLIINILGKQVYNSVTERKDESRDSEGYKYSKTIDNVTLSLNIPNEWKHEEVSPTRQDNYKYALKLYKSQENKNVTLYFYNDPFVVCGTGRTSNDMTLNNGEKAFVGYYGDKAWSDISFHDLNPNIALLNNGLENIEAEEALDIVKTINIKNN